jgi:hypothetical protein
LNGGASESPMEGCCRGALDRELLTGRSYSYYYYDSYNYYDWYYYYDSYCYDDSSYDHS